MDHLNQINEELLSLRGQQTPVLSSNFAIDTPVWLDELASKTTWGAIELERVTFLSKRMDISGKLFCGYDFSGKRATDHVLNDPVLLEITTAIFFKFALLQQDSARAALQFKALNTLYKALEKIEPSWLAKDSLLGTKLEAMLYEAYSAMAIARDEDYPVILTDFWEDRREDVLHPLELTLLFYEGPIARAYLEILRSLGYKPSKIVELVSFSDVATGKPVGKWLPKGLRPSYAASVQKAKIHYWPTQIAKRQRRLVEEIQTAISDKFKIDMILQKRAQQLRPLQEYSDDVETVIFRGLNDIELQHYIQSNVMGDVLYTGGGIVPAALLALDNINFLHVHPGFLPGIRGADCVLWSNLVANHSSATLFYMAPGIDTGDIIDAQWLPRVEFNIDATHFDQKMLYRAVFGFLDPWVRAYVLRSAFKPGGSFSTVNPRPQAIEEGTTFHFMHEKVVARALDTLFTGG